MKKQFAEQTCTITLFVELSVWNMEKLESLSRGTENLKKATVEELRKCQEKWK